MAASASSSAASGAAGGASGPAFDWSELPERINFPGMEETVLAYWKSINAFEESLARSKGKPEFVFYDGPPFATGLPHYGHILAGTIKDIVTRYAGQTGHHVPRRFGWDCHGLPVEYEIDRQEGIKGRDDVMAMGIPAYNALCRGIVLRYTAEWEHVVTRMGRWIDFKNDYKTMQPEYMESVWWVFKSLWEKGLVYRSFKVMPYSTACNTPLSNFEAGLNYKEDTRDPAVVVAFPLVSEPEVSFVAWTTTPWTLPSNLALCVHPDLMYVRVKDLKSGRVYILAATRTVQLYPKSSKAGYAGGEFELQGAPVPGRALVGLKYTPLFPYFTAAYPHAFTVLADGYVSDDAGTGIVHQAPAFGEDDWRVCTAAGVVARDSGELPCPIDANGRFTDEVPDFKGMYIKDADARICDALKAAGRLVVKSDIVHSYPFCWRSDTPLIYRAVPSWFVRVEAIKDRLLAANEQTSWTPDSVKSGRFHNWLRDARDWAISRNRFWGTPLPIWTSEDGSEVLVVGSIGELAALSGVTVTDLHRDTVDSIPIVSPTTGATLRRVDEVFDCWFESGSMPYAQVHYPFENKDRFRIPADFIAEGLDQTRGWFYTLMVLSTALFDAPAFSNVIVNGLVLAGDGKKMSKRLKNYPDPMTIVASYGADALRLYLINSPVVKAEPLRFKADGVASVVKDVFLPWYNACRFFTTSTALLKSETGVAFKSSRGAAAASTNMMDMWIMANIQSLIRFVRAEMAAYRLYTVVPRLVAFIRDLTNWYVRLNRRRLKCMEGAGEAFTALSVLHSVLMDTSILFAPFTPFVTEVMYQTLKLYSDADASACVHWESIPPVTGTPNEALLASVATMQSVIEAARVCRDRKATPVRIPLRGLTVVSSNAALCSQVVALESYIAEEVNVKSVHVSGAEDEWVSVTAILNASLGRTMKDKFAAVSEAVKRLTQPELRAFLAAGTVHVAGVDLSRGDIIIKREPLRAITAAGRFEAVCAPDGAYVVFVDMAVDAELKSAGAARETAAFVQRCRKSAGLRATDEVAVYMSVSLASEAEFMSSEGVDAAAATLPAREAAVQVVRGCPACNDDLITHTLRGRIIPAIPAAMPPYLTVLGTFTETLCGAVVTITLARPCVRFAADNVLMSSVLMPVDGGTPAAEVANAACFAPTGVPSTPAPVPVVPHAAVSPSVMRLHGLKYSLAMADLNTLRAPEVRITLDGSQLTLTRAVHFFTSMEEYAGAAHDSARTEWEAQLPGHGAAAFDAFRRAGAAAATSTTTAA